MTPAIITRRALTLATAPALRDAERKATEARDAWIRGLQDAWKHAVGQMQPPPDNGDPNGDEDDGETVARATSTSSGCKALIGRRLATVQRR